MSLTPEQVLDAISEMSVMDVVQLVRAVEDKFGVSAAAVSAVSVAAAAAPGGAEGAAEEEKTEFDVKLVDVGAKKIEVIKVVKAIMGLGLKESKDMVEKAGDGGAVIKEGVDKEEADAVKARLEEAGAKVELA